MVAMTAQVHAMPDNFSRRVGEEVRALMARHGVNQTQVAATLGIHQSAVSKRLTGRTPFDVNELAAVARFFRTTTANIIAAAENPRPDLDPNGGLGVRQEGLEPPTRWLAPVLSMTNRNDPLHTRKVAG